MPNTQLACLTVYYLFMLSSFSRYFQFYLVNTIPYLGI
ncbi:MAG: hypothetical protein N4J56_006799 [Chroococcidiopsis sp. SAG 2025]|nr:hypothetical protein [Chroococcidiopsis sp. SAG 2025]